MPTYQYRCKQCGDEFEKVQSFSDESTPKCPTCGTRSKKNISKVFGQVGISFKGAGFYKNDHRANASKSSSDNGSDSSSTTSKSDSSAKGESTKSESSKSDSSKSDSSKSESVKTPSKD